MFGGFYFGQSYFGEVIPVQQGGWIKAVKPSGGGSIAAPVANPVTWSEEETPS